jgi:phosphoglycolate phosphatase-like HAD superfamily hydrolase
VFRVFALDFDGVISDSAAEAFVVAVRTYVAMRPTGALAGSDFPGSASPRLEEVERHSCYRRFLDAMPLGNRAEDFGVALAAIEGDERLDDQADHDRAAAGLDPDWLQAYHENFYRTRAAMCAADLRGWLALMGPYAPFLDVLRRRSREVELAIATSKDRTSVRRLLEAYAVDDLFPEAAVLDKETGSSKAAHLTRLRARHDCAFSEITFIDDKVNHLDVAAELGVRCVLAGWGFNGKREAQLAARAGYLVCSLDDVERRLFD